MKIAIATSNFTAVSGHAGKTRQWLVYDLTGYHPNETLPAPQRITLEKHQVLHTFADAGPHPLDGVDSVLAASAGEGFIRHMKKRGSKVLVTGGTDPTMAIACILAGEALPGQRFDITTIFCKVRDLLSRH